MAGDIYVSFGADTGDLEAALAVARVGVNSYAAEMRKLAAEMRETGAAADSELGARMRTLGQEMTAAKGVAASLKEQLAPIGSGARSTGEALKESGSHAELAGRGLGFYVREAHALADEVGSGRLRQAQGTFANMFMTFAQANPAMAGTAAAVIAVAGAFAYMIYQALGTKDAIERMKAALDFTGVAGVTQAQIGETIKTIHALPEASYDDAKKVAISWATMQNGSAAVFQAMTADITDYAKITGQNAPEAGAKLKDLFEKPFDAADRLKNAFGALTESEAALYKEANKSLDPARAQAAIQQIMADHLDNVRKARIAEIDAEIEHHKTLADLDEEIFRETGVVNHEVEVLEKEKAALQASTEEFNKRTQALNSATSSLDAIRQRFADVAAAANPAATNIEKITATIATLREGLRGSTTDAGALIKQMEGFSAKAYKDSDGKFRAGFGSDTTTDANGNVSKVTADTVTTREDAERDLARRVVEFQNEAAREIGAAWAGLSDKAKASITSVTYNYGHVPDSVKNAARGGDDSQIAGAIGGLSSNASRRQQEANNITGPTLSGVNDPALLAKGDAALKQALDDQQKLNDAAAGGNAIAQASLATAQREAAGKKDELQAAREHLEAAKQVAAQANTEASQKQAALEVAKATGDLKDKEAAATKANLALAVQETEEPKKKLAAQQALYDFEMSLYAKGTAQYIQAEAQKKAAEDAYTKQEVSDSAAAETTKYRDALQGIEAKKALLRQEVADHEISNSDLLAGDLRLQAQRVSVEQAYFAKMRDLYTEGTKDWTKYQEQLNQVAAKAAAERQQISTQDSKKIAQDYQHAFESIGNTVSSSIMGMIRGTENFQQMMSKIALQIINTFVSMGVKMVADWMANQARQVVVAVTGQQEITAAQLAGAATRTGSVAAEAAAGSATTIASVIKSITASASETFAGVFGFLSPVMGPAAAGPAAASMGQVMAVASFDIGAWNIDRDQLAMVHKNEMIMPAAESGALRSMLSNAAGAGGGAPTASAGGDNHVHLNVSALDSGSVKGWLGGNSRQIMKAMNQAIKDGNHIGLRRLATS